MGAWCVMTPGFELITYTCDVLLTHNFSLIYMASPGIFSTCTHSLQRYPRPGQLRLSVTTSAALRTDGWYDLQVQHEDERRDSREHVAWLVEFEALPEGGLQNRSCGATGTEARR